MTREQKEQAQKYFRAHPLGFSRISSRHRPGSDWILHRQAEFHLTAEQVQAEARLKRNGLSIPHNFEPSDQLLREGLDTKKSVW